MCEDAFFIFIFDIVYGEVYYTDGDSCLKRKLEAVPGLRIKSINSRENI